MAATSLEPLAQDTAERIAADLVAEMTRRWRVGERPLPEEFLQRRPELFDHPEVAADLIYEELCLREEFGPDISVEEVVGRFPQWKQQVELLFDCQRLLGPKRPAPRFPSAGESLGDFLLLAELGRGVHGRVFLASQLSLGDRPVVVKLTSCDANEHLSLARLQHTYIVPLYSVQDDQARGLRALCMPYFGGTTLSRLLDELRSTPPANRKGQDLLAALERIPIAEPFIAPARQAARPNLSSTNFAHAICWVGACLADALQYAHDRGLVHLDLKPSNVLVSADCQPMVLDFHLAREPIHPEDPGPAWLGGTPGYMSPEQAAALVAVRHCHAIPESVDGRSDIFSLGVVLYEALAGGLPWPLSDAQEMTTVLADTEYISPGESPTTKCPSLYLRNPQVSVGLSDIIAKCLAANPNDRYQTMAGLATDLRRHMGDRPLSTVRNRSLMERWHKWRRRRPHGVALMGMMSAVLVAACAVALGAASHVSDRIDQGRVALADGRVQTAKGEWELAAGTLRRGLSAVRGLPWQGELAGELERRIALAEDGKTAADRNAAAAELHRLADKARFMYGSDRYTSSQLAEFSASYRAFWNDREQVVARLRPEAISQPDSIVRADLMDIAICSAYFESDPIAMLDQAETLLGLSAVLDQERRLHGAAIATRPTPIAPQTVWEHYALGRAYLRSGELERATAETDEALRLDPHGLWPNFYHGVCNYRRGRFVNAAAAFGVCIGAAPDAAGGYYHRALAFAALNQKDAALRDYNQALRLEPTLSSAVLDKLRHGPTEKTDTPAPLRSPNSR